MNKETKQNYVKTFVPAINKKTFFVSLYKSEISIDFLERNFLIGLISDPIPQTEIPQVSKIIINFEHSPQSICVSFMWKFWQNLLFI